MPRIQAELKLRYKEFFESKLAVEFLNQGESFDSVKKVSAAIVKLMEDRRQQIINLITFNKKIIADLREPFFGNLFSTTESVSSKDIFNRMLSTLKFEQANLSKILQIHCVFEHRIYNVINNQEGKSSFYNQMHPKSVFESSDTRGRKEKNVKNIEPTLKLGIVHNPVFTKLLGRCESLHSRAVDEYEPNHNATFFRPAQGVPTPAVAGASGHTASLMAGASLYGKLSKDELKEYAFACFVFLTAGGNHSFYEVMAIAKLADIDLDEQSYAACIPPAIEKLSLHKILAKIFPEFLDSAEETTHRASSTSTL